jgi:hypothetical protein
LHALGTRGKDCWHPKARVYTRRERFRGGRETRGGREVRRSREIPRAARVCARACGRLCRTGKARGGHVFFSSSHQRLLGNDRALLPYLLFFGSKPGARSGRFLGFQTQGKKTKQAFLNFFTCFRLKRPRRARPLRHTRGERDARAVPALVECIVETSFDAYLATGASPTPSSLSRSPLTRDAHG